MFGKNYFFGKGSNYRSYKDMMMMERIFFPKVLKDVMLKKGDKILDIGCAFGYFLKLCDEIGCETFGVDISGYAIKQAKKETKAKLYVHDVNKGLPMFKNGYFDLVVMFDVIEHLDSPYNTLKEVYRVLKSNGNLILTTPNLNAIGRFLRKILGKEKNWHGFYDKTHIYLFTPTNLEFLMGKTNFKIIKKETPFYQLPQLLQKIANKTGLGGQIWIVASKT